VEEHHPAWKDTADRSLIYVSYWARITMTKGSIQQEDSLHQQIRLRAKEETNEVLYLEHSFVWCGNLDSSETSSEVPGKFRNVVLEKDGEQKLDRPHK
jgi:hypothetical protein